LLGAGGVGAGFGGGGAPVGVVSGRPGGVGAPRETGLTGPFGTDGLWGMGFATSAGDGMGCWTGSLPRSDRVLSGTTGWSSRVTIGCSPPVSIRCGPDSGCVNPSRSTVAVVVVSVAG
jgi:hypothetical protein